MDRLPNEINSIILNQLDNASRRILRATCKHLFDIIDYRNFTIYLTKKSEWPQIVDRLASYNQPIGLKFAKNIMKTLKDINEHLLRLTNLTSLEFDQLEEATYDGFDEQEWLKLTTLSNLQAISTNHNYIYHVPLQPLLNLPNLSRFDKCNSCQNVNYEQLAQSIQRWTNLQYFRLEQNEQIEIDLFNNLSTKLTYLSLGTSFMKISTIEKLFEKVPNLKDLTIELYDRDKYAKGDLISYKSLTSLQRLSLPPIGYTDKILQLSELNSKHLTFLELTHVEEKIIERELSWLVNLKYFKVSLFLDDQEKLKPIYDLEEDYYIVPEIRYTCQWLTAMTALEYLNIGPVQHDALEFITTSRLTHLTIDIDRETSADLVPLTRFDSLKELTILSASEDASIITALTNLNSLSAEFERRISKNELLPLSNLTELSAGEAEVDHLPNLETLSLATLNENSGLTDLPKLTNLEIRYSEPAYCERISSLSALKAIVIYCSDGNSCKLFSTLTALESLSFWWAKEADYDKLSTLTNLTELTISRAALSRTLLHLPTSLQVLRINHCALGEDPDNTFKNDPTLEEKILARLPYLYEYSFYPDLY